MRDIVFTAVMAGLLAMAVWRPFIGVLLWSWVSFMNPHRLVWGFAMELPWATLTLLATVAGCALQREPKRFAANAVTVLLLVFAADVTITSLLAIAPKTIVWEQWGRMMKVLVGLMLTASMLDSRLRIHAMTWLMVIAVGYFGVRGGIFTLVNGGNYIVQGPPATMIEDRNQLAVALLVAVPLMNYLRMYSAHRIVRIGLVAAMVLTVFSAIGTQSRGALVALVATAGLFWLRSRGKFVSGILVVLVVALVITFMPEAWVERMRTIGHYEDDGSAMGRVTIWRAAVALALMRPLLGGGFRAIYNQDIVSSLAPGVESRAAHSVWFEVLSDHGFPGLIIWASIIGATVLYTLRITRIAEGREELRWAADLARMSQASLVAYCVGGSLLSLPYWDLSWTLCVVVAATYGVVAQTAQAPARAGPTTEKPPARMIPAPAWRTREARQ